MKMLLCNVWDDSENVLPYFYDFLDSIESYSKPLTEDEQKEMPTCNGGTVNTRNFIFCETFKFDRFDTALIQFIEENYISKNKTCFFHIEHFDERFTNTKYYKIKTDIYTHRNRFFYSEKLLMNYETIIADLYNKKYEYIIPLE